MAMVVLKYAVTFAKLKQIGTFPSLELNKEPIKVLTYVCANLIFF